MYFQHGNEASNVGQVLYQMHINKADLSKHTKSPDLTIFSLKNPRKLLIILPDNACPRFLRNLQIALCEQEEPQTVSAVKLVSILYHDIRLLTYSSSFLVKGACRALGTLTVSSSASKSHPPLITTLDWYILWGTRICWWVFNLS